MRPADATRRTIRLYVALGSLAAALGVGVALGADPHPDPAPVVASASITINPGAMASAYDSSSGQS